MEPIKYNLSNPEERSAPFAPDETHAFVLPKQETNATTPPASEAQNTIDVNATIPNNVSEVQSVSPLVPVVENAAVRPPNITEQNDHNLPFGTKFADLQANVAASEAKTQQVLLPQQPVTETPKTGFMDKVSKWLKFGR